jgi:hypothetical protein
MSNRKLPLLQLLLQPLLQLRQLLPLPLLLLLLLTVQIARAQTSTSSPYSRYGIGDLQFGGFAKNIAMGGLSYGLNQPFNINFSNPASYTGLLLTTVEAGFGATFLELRNSTSKGEANNVSFGYFSLGFPVKTKKWGMSFGILPYSDVGYSISKSELNEAGDRRNLDYAGHGGLNQMYLGNAVALTKGLSIGMNASFLFGTINQERKIYFPDGGYLNTHVVISDVINDLYLGFGIQQTFDSLGFGKSDSLLMYDILMSKNNDSLKIVNKQLKELNKTSPKDSAAASEKIEKMKKAQLILNAERKNIDSLADRVVRRRQRSNWSLTLGITGTPPMKLRGTLSVLAENYILDGYGNESVRDTILNTSDHSQRLKLPLSMGFGFAVKQGARWLTGADFSLQNWRDYSLFGQSDSLANSWRVAVGAQFTPDEHGVKSYVSQVSYRLGFHYEQTYLQLNNGPLNQMGISLGLGFPFRRSPTMLHLTLEAGRRGTTHNSLIEENYIKTTLGFTLNDRWFVKSKFD